MKILYICLPIHSNKWDNRARSDFNNLIKI